MKKILLSMVLVLLVLFSETAFACWGEEEERAAQEAIYETESEICINEDDLYALAHIIMGEGESCCWEYKVATGSVVLNRVADERFPSTVIGVKNDPNQWAPTWDGRYWLEPNQECWDAAEYVLVNGSQLPADVVWESAVPQGKYTYEVLEGIYFCG